MKKQPTYNLDEDLLRKYLSGDLSSNETQALEKILESDPSARQHLEQMEKIWKLSGSIVEIQSIDTEGDWKTISRKISTTGQKRQLDFHANHKQEASRELTLNPARTMAFRIARIAAIFIMVSISAYMLYYFTGSGPMSKIRWITVNSTESQQQINMPDGSNISLNIGSSLVYPSRFKNSERLVTLEGEAFFDIAREKNRPFIINIADQAAVEVLGTSFNLRQDPKNKKVFLNVLTGKVAFYSRANKKDAKVLEQYEQAVYENGRVTQTASFDLNFLSWKTRTLEFENTPLSDVAEQLGRHYRTEIRLMDSQLDTLSLTGIYKNQSLDDVIEEIALVLDLEVRNEGGIIQVSSYENPVVAE
ncbi:FecR domain-containing protein [Bacteroidota bacterium]